MTGSGEPSAISSTVARGLLSNIGTTKKGAAVAGGSKVKQGGVKQSGQEPLDVQKLDDRVMVEKA